MKAYLKRLLENARQTGQQISLNDLIKEAVADKMLLDEAIRETREAIENESIDMDLVSEDVLHLTHKNEIAVYMEEKLQMEFEQDVVKLQNKAEQLYNEFVGKPKIEPNNTATVQNEAKPEVKPEGKPLKTPFDNAKTPFQQ